MFEGMMLKHTGRREQKSSEQDKTGKEDRDMRRDRRGSAAYKIKGWRWWRTRGVPVAAPGSPLPVLQFLRLCLRAEGRRGWCAVLDNPDPWTTAAPALVFHSESPPSTD